MRLGTLAALNRERAARRACLLVTDLVSREQRLVTMSEIPADPIGESLAARLRTGRSGIVEQADGRFFVNVQEPPVRLVLIGAVHISQALAPMAKVAGLDVTVIDPRTAFATPERFADVDLRALWPDEALRALRPDRFTAIAALSHDPKIDDPALLLALQTDCFYVGALGSRKSHVARCERLLKQGAVEAELGRIRAPIGLDIGAVSPAEIAVSVLGEVVSGLRRKPARTADTLP